MLKIIFIYIYGRCWTPYDFIFWTPLVKTLALPPVGCENSWDFNQVIPDLIETSNLIGSSILSCVVVLFCFFILFLSIANSVFILDARVEQSVYALLRTRDMAASRYREFGIPTDWLQDSGVVGKVRSHLETSLWCPFSSLFNIKAQTFPPRTMLQGKP